MTSPYVTTNLNSFYRTKQAGILDYLKAMLAGGAVGAGAGGLGGAGYGYLKEGPEQYSAGIQSLRDAAQGNFEGAMKDIQSGSGQAYLDALAQGKDLRTDRRGLNDQLTEYNDLLADSDNERNRLQELISYGEMLGSDRASYQAKRDQEQKYIQEAAMRASRIDPSGDTTDPQVRAAIKQLLAEIDAANYGYGNIRQLDTQLDNNTFNADIFNEDTGGLDMLARQLGNNEWNADIQRSRRDSIKDDLAQNIDDISAAKLLAEGLRDDIKGQTRQAINAKNTLNKDLDNQVASGAGLESARRGSARDRGLQGMGLGALLGGGAGLGYKAIQDLLFSDGQGANSVWANPPQMT